MNRLLTICLIGFGYFCQAQEPYFQKIETVNGIASDKVYCVVQSKKGEIWFGTDAGVSVFDGYSFSNFDNRRDLAADEIFEIYQDSKDRIWFLSQNGELSYYQNGTLFNGTNVKALAEIHIKSDLTSVWEKSNGDLVFSSYGNGIFQLDSSLKATRIYIPSVFRVWGTMDGKLFALGIEGIYEIKNNVASQVENFESGGHYARSTVYKDTCFIAVGDKLYYYLDGLNFIDRLPDQVEATFIARNGNSFDIGTRTGAYVGYKPGIKTGHKRLVEGSVISTIFKDREGNLWVSTVGDGVYFSASPDINIYNTKSGLAVDPVTTLYQAGQNELWLGYRNGSYGIKKNNQFINDPKTTPTNEPVTQIKKDAQNGEIVLSKYFVTWIDSTGKKNYLRLLINDLLFDSRDVYIASNRTYKIPINEFYKSMGTSQKPGSLSQELLKM